MMKLLLRLSRAIDWLNERVGRLVYWLVLAAVLISSANALSRYMFHLTSNGWLEVQPKDNSSGCCISRPFDCTITSLMD